MYHERTKQEPAGGLLFYLEAGTKGGIAGVSTKVKSFDELMRDDLNDFRAAQRLYRREHPRNEPKEFDMPMALMRTEGFVEAPSNYVLGFSEPPLASLQIVPQMPKAEEKPKAKIVPRKAEKAVPAKAEEQQKPLFDESTTEKYKK
jgi:hypothetical protein